jgi:sugar lactone lactonase YvrE
MKIQLFCILFTFSLVLSGQTPDTIDTYHNEPYIKWIASLPSDEIEGNKRFFEKIFDIIFGSDPVIINNPVSVYAKNIKEYWIVNHGDGTLLHFHDGEIKKVPVFKKDVNVFPSLVGISQWGLQGILFVDSRLNRIFSLSIDGKEYTPFGKSNDLSRPTGIAYSEITGEIWVAETGSHRISVFNSNGDRIKIIGQRGNGNLEFNFPTYIWIDSSGRIYIVDSMNFRIQVLSANGDFITAFGEQGNATGYFARPRGIATDSNGNIYVVDALFNVVQVFDINGKLLYYFGSQGRGKYQFWMPSGIYIDKSDYIYVSDSYNGRVQVFKSVKNYYK